MRMLGGMVTVLDKVGTCFAHYLGQFPRFPTGTQRGQHKRDGSEQAPDATENNGMVKKINVGRKGSTGPML